MKKSIIDLKATLEAEKMGCEEASLKTHRLEAKYESLIRLEKDMIKVLEQMEGLKIQLEKKKKARKQLKEIKKNSILNESELRNLKTSEQVFPSSVFGFFFSNWSSGLASDSHFEAG